ncbi:MAG: TetR/AcrR family transcriptional regulator [Slackia faecicanis]|nr:TetR/AcrR family transcriptional regulator [Slackia faecicanis]
MAYDSNDLRARRTHSAIQNAMHELVLENEPDKITVKAIAERAAINRKTFYLHYDSIESLYEEAMLDLIDYFFEYVEETPDAPEDIIGHAKRFFLYLAGQEAWVERLICTRSYYDFGGRLYREQMARYSSVDAAKTLFSWTEDEEPLVRHFIRSSALQFFRGWVRNGRAVEKERAAELLGNLTMHGIAPIMKLD